MKGIILKKSNSVTELAMVADLTGGMGIDSMALARVAKHVDYVERDSGLCQMMEHNCRVLGLNNISVHCGDSIEWLKQSGKHFDIIFIDPARRDNHGKKVAAFEDCTPNILEHRKLIADSCEWLMVKASPMMDIDMGVAQLATVSEVNVVAVKGECKELVFMCRMREDGKTGLSNKIGEARIYAYNIVSDGDRERKKEQGRGNRQGWECHFGFTRSEETEAKAFYCRNIGQYLYEPDAALMKSGPYKLLCQGGRFEKLDRSTHLYTSDELMEWSGRIFSVVSEVALNKKAIAAVIPERKAHMVVRNYPAEAAVLQKQLGLKEGGEMFVIATTVAGVKKGLVCKSVKPK